MPPGRDSGKCGGIKARSSAAPTSRRRSGDSPSLYNLGEPIERTGAGAASPAAPSSEPAPRAGTLCGTKYHADTEAGPAGVKLQVLVIATSEIRNSAPHAVVGGRPPRIPRAKEGSRRRTFR